MANPGELVRTLADALGIDRSTIAQQDRLLAESGLRTTGGRGRSAPHVSPRDAASLLLAVVAPPITGPQVRDTVETFRAYSDLQAHLSPQDNPFGDAVDQLGDWSTLAVMRELPPGHSLVSAVAALISVFMDGQFEDAQQVWGPALTHQLWPNDSTRQNYELDVRSAPVHLRVTFTRDGLSAGSNIYIHSNSREHSALFRAELDYWLPKAKKRPDKDALGDLVQTSSVSEVTFRAIADLLNRDRRAS